MGWNYMGPNLEKNTKYIILVDFGNDLISGTMKNISSRVLEEI